VPGTEPKRLLGLRRRGRERDDPGAGRHGQLHERTAGGSGSGMHGHPPVRDGYRAGQDVRGRPADRDSRRDVERRAGLERDHELGRHRGELRVSARQVSEVDDRLAN
jgi:hypothetical protein